VLAVKQLDKKTIGSRLVRVIAAYTSGSEVNLNAKSSKKDTFSNLKEDRKPGNWNKASHQRRIDEKKVRMKIKNIEILKQHIIAKEDAYFEPVDKKDRQH
jgi:hypothetical protein